ncbi:MAG: hypothetical protein ACK4TB_00050 [Gemmobacter sp.]
MAAIVDAALAEGSIGFAAGLDYPAGAAASFDAVLALAARVGPAGGLRPGREPSTAILTPAA